MQGTETAIIDPSFGSDRSPFRARKIVHLQALRAIAASGVVLDHSLGVLVRRHSVDPALQPLAWFFGWLAVAVFFVISGLIMVRTSWHSFGHCHGWSFFQRRLARVVPLYWIATIPEIMLNIAAHKRFSLIDVVKSGLFIPYQGFSSAAFQPILGQGWTLNLEMVFYLLFAICLFMRRSVALPLLTLGLIALVLLASFWRPLVPYGDPEDVVSFWVNPIIVLFAAGMALGAAEARSIKWHATSYPIVGTVGLLLLAILGFIAEKPSFPLQIEFQAAFGVVALVTVWLCTSVKRGNNTTMQSVLERLGDASYSTYLFHGFVISALAELASRIELIRHWPLLFVAAALAGSNALGLIVNRWLERPLMRRFAPHLPPR